MPNAPRAMVNLETWVPSNFEVDDWQVEDVGPLGSGGRSVGIYDHLLFSLKRDPFSNFFWLNTGWTVMMWFFDTCGTLTLGFLAKISFTPLSYHPGRCLGCPEKQTSSRNYNLFIWFVVFQPKWNDIQKSYKNYQNPLKSYCFLEYFQSLFNFG
jgi:hypothetical protein